MIRMCNVERLPHRFSETRTEHLAILHPLGQTDADLAREHMRKHIDQVRISFPKLLSMR